ncbi:MAG TPA: serine hydroxymethyltransferase [SAR324 cluster bacterium]|nr:serine hydroxymethyltransferase [SAR324 cluster bacterium]
MDIKTEDIQSLVEQQNNWRGKECLNLIASENTQSPNVRNIEVNDFMGRYAEGHPNTNDEDRRYYEGTRWIDEIERIAEQEIIELAGCQQADVRPISGNAANTALALGILRGGDTVVVNSIEQGGHISHNPIGVVGRRIQKRGQVLNLGKENSIDLNFWPATEDGYHLDANACVDLLENKRPNLAILGKSLFLFPEPVKEIAEACRNLKIPLLYDGAHVLGLILGGCFQDPFREGAHFINASTHKTFPGPQRGVILGNLQGEDELKWWTSIDRGVMPGSSSSHHLHTLPGLVIAIREMKVYGKAYAKQTIKNAKALGQALDDEGVDVEAKEFGFTESHQLALRVTRYGEAKKIARHLAEQNIICNYNQLPGDPDPGFPSGLRLGVQEMTRMGMTENEMGDIAQLMSSAIKGKKVLKEVGKLRERFNAVCYC